MRPKLYVGVAGISFSLEELSLWPAAGSRSGAIAGRFGSEMESMAESVSAVEITEDGRGISRVTAVEITAAGVIDLDSVIESTAVKISFDD